MYIPPCSENLIFQQFSNVFKSFITIAQCKFDDMIVTCGDFNCPSVNWFNEIDNNNIYFPSNSSSNDMFNLLLSSDLSQINCVKNFQNKLLDLAFVSNCDKISLSKRSLPLLPVDLRIIFLLY